MAKYKEYDYSQGKFIPINFDKQILPGTFEHTLHYLIDSDLDLSAFDLRYKNDESLREGDYLKSEDRRLLQRERHLHGSLRRHPAAFHHQNL